VNPHALNILLQSWPAKGARTSTEKNRLRRVASVLGVTVQPTITRDQLRRSVVQLHHRRAAHRLASVPWKYQKYLRPNQPIRQQAIKLQPGAMIPVSFNGMETTMHIDMARRLNYRGHPWFLEMRVKLDTEHVPIILTREAGCDCLYCGTRPVSDEESCRKCGAPLSC